MMSRNFAEASSVLPSLVYGEIPFTRLSHSEARFAPIASEKSIPTQLENERRSVDLFKIGRL